MGSVNYSGEVFPLRLNVSISSEETYLQGAVYEGEANCSQVVRLECESQGESDQIQRHSRLGM